MACRGIELAIGQIWLTRHGQRLTISGYNDVNTNYPWTVKDSDGAEWFYTADGRYHYRAPIPDCRDLGALVFNPKLQDGKYTVEEVLSASAEIFNSPLADMERVASRVKETLRKREDPEYAKYLELKAKFEK